MAAILYKLESGEVVKEMVHALDVAGLLEAGYSDCPEKLLKRQETDTNKTGKLSAKEVKEAAKKAGIKITGKSVVKIKEELGL